MSTNNKLKKDRLSALQAVQSYDDDIVPEEEPLEVKNCVRFMDAFFNQVEEIHKMIEKIQHNIEEVKKKHTSILNAPQSDKKIKQELEDLMGDIGKNSIEIRTKLNHIKQEKHTQESLTAMRIRKIQHSTLFKKFSEIMTGYNSMQVEYTERYKSKIQRQQDLDIECVQSNSIAYIPDFIQKMHQSQQTLSDVEARHANIKKLEKDIRELHHLFFEMLVLVESQSDTIDRIEDYVTQTMECVSKTAWE